MHHAASRLPEARLAIFFSQVVYLDAARDSALVQVRSGRTSGELSCTAWMMERETGSRGYRYVRGHHRGLQ